MQESDIAYPFELHTSRCHVQLGLCFEAGKSGKVIPTFLGYLVHEGATLLADAFVRHTQLAVVLDLDETLLVANSLSQLESQMVKAKESR